MARVLLAEPDRAIREFIAGILAEFDHDVVICDNVIDASVWLATSPIDVLVTDIVLHADQGAMLLTNCAALGVRMITLTGREFHADQSEAARPAALREKPFRFSDLHRVLAAVGTPRSSAMIGRESNAA